MSAGGATPSTPSTRPARPDRLGGLKTVLVAALVVLIYFGSAASLKISLFDLFSGQTWGHMGDLLLRMGPYHKISTCRDASIRFSNEKYHHLRDAVCVDGKTVFDYDPELLQGMFNYIPNIWPKLAETLQIAIIGAFIGAIIAIPLSVLGARNLVKSDLVYYSARTLLNLIRTIPDLALAALLVGMLGIGVLPGVTAVSIFSFSLISKLASETIEAIDPGPVEALQASGANRLQLIWYAVVPQVLPQYLAYGLYVLEINVRASFILGYVGAGGVGQLLNADLTFGRWRNVSAIVILILLVVLVIDFISARLRERLV